MNRKTANTILSKLDETASMIESLIKRKMINRVAGIRLLRNVDTFADKFEIAAFGKESFNARRERLAKVIKRDSDEPYMDAFENIQEPIKIEADELYMKEFEDDISSAVANRDEFDVRELNQYAGGTEKQPTWPKGSSGDSLKPVWSRK